MVPWVSDGEYGFAPNWSFGIEYDRLFMGDANNSFSVPNPLLVNAANRISQDVDTAHASDKLPFRRLREPGRCEILSDQPIDA